MKKLRKATLARVPAGMTAPKISVQGQSGFTLVELSIVLVIIGLIIGGILKGQELIGNAQVKNVMAQTESYKAATVAFADKYNALPGDLLNADNLVPNCTSTLCNPPGNGNGIVGIDAGANYNGAVGDDPENVAFWQQLGSAKFISGVELGTTSTANFGSQFPSASTGGGFQFIYHAATGRHLVRLSGSPTIFNPANGALRPDQALQLDNRIDDGKPTSGAVLTTSQLSSTTTCYDSTTLIYLAANQVKSCNLVFEIP